ncbi:GNAT family N-acetyltransferase [Sciscionella sediminilitoris]|uniref:GNAT family N-acetyltransferase n=1 Tax=Sciscionella sediminilitoris TaxID=1445613 RepID=UPI0004DF9E30|nr:GNAT family N-acetyltransferase [Sciscionella sp. SE31]
MTVFGTDGVNFRGARADEAEQLGALALRSKAHWGYSQEQLDAFAVEFSFAPEELGPRRMTVAETGGEILGFYNIEGTPPEGELGNLWLEPARIGAGLGRMLWEHAVRAAREHGFQSLVVTADPNAEGFYRAMGAEPAGSAPSGSIPGRMLPVFRIRLS